MARPFLSLYARRLVAPTLLGIASVILAFPAFSTERRSQDAKIPAIPGTDAVTGNVPDVVDTVFRSRWLGSAREFSVDAAGKIQASNRVPSSDLIDSKSAAIGVSGLALSDSQFDLSSTETGPACGPSPLSASDIARLVVAAARKHQVDPDFALAIAATESRLDRARNSPKGARGPMQLMPSTAAFLGVADICDPAENIDGGIRLLKSLFETYRNPFIVAAAYNAGETNVQKYGGIPPFPETVRFVAEVVNRQLGLPTLEAGKGERTKIAPVATAIDDVATGVLGAGKSRQWVGGVMQF